MKIRTKQWLSTALALAMGAGAAGIVPITSGAADEYQSLAEWSFDSDTDAAEWKKGGYWTSTVTGGDVGAEQGTLKLTEDFSGCTGTWNQTSVNTSIAKNEEFADAARITFDYYTASAPSRLMAVFAGSVAGTYTKADGTSAENPWANAQEIYVFADVAVETADVLTVDGEDYIKYEITLPLSDSAMAYNYSDLPCKTVRAQASSFTVGEVRTDSSYTGAVCYDNIKIQKQGGEAAPDPETKSVTLSDGVAVCNEAITASASGFAEGAALTYQWYVSSDAACGEPKLIEAENAEAFVPKMEQIGGWIFCEVSDGAETVKSAPVRAAASKAESIISLPISSSKIGDYDLALLNNTTDTSGKIDKKKWAAGGYIHIDFTGISDGAPENLPQLDMGTWSVDRKTVDVKAARHGENADGSVWAEYTYEDMLAGWYDDADFGDLKALRVKYSGSDKSELTVVNAFYAGPTLSYGDLGEPVSLRGSYSGYQYLFTRHVGGRELDATTLKEDDFFYAEYAEADSDETVNLVAQCHSAKADGTDVKSTYAVIAPSETGKTGSGNYAKYTVSDIKAVFGEKFRYIDGLRIATASGSHLTANASLYLFRGTGALVDDISVDGYSDAVDVPWTLYDNDPAYSAKDGIAVIGASITQNPLVTALAMSGKPFYSANGGWSPMLDRTDVVTYGIGSQTTDDIAARFHEVLDYNYKQIIIQCGNNDLGNYSTGEAAAQAEYDNYIKMLDMVKTKNDELKAQGKPIIPVHILAINPVKSEATNAKIQTVIEKLDTLEQVYDFVTYVKEINGEFLDAETGFSKENLVMSDGLHPVAEGYAIYARYLKPLLSTNNDADSTLASLSYRMSDSFDVNEAKKVVPGFASGKAAAADGYSVTMPDGAAPNALFRLYTAASNTGKATVAVNGTAPANTDEYGNEYTNITLSNGAAAVEVAVTAADGSQSVYKINFTADGAVTPSEYIYESAEEKTMNEQRDGSWSAWVQYDVAYSGAVYSGAVIEFDVTAQNSDFTSLGLLLNNSWANLAGDAVSGVTLKAEDFTDNKCHVSYTYEGTGMESFATLQIKANENADYMGNITISNVRIKNGGAPEVTVPLNADKAVYNTAIAFKDKDDSKVYTYRWYKRTLPNAEGAAIDGAEDESFTPAMAELGAFIYCERTADGVTETSDTVPVFADGEKKTYTLSDEELAVNANYGLFASPILTSLRGGAFNPITIKPYGQFKVTYSGDADIQLILSNYHGEGENNKWIAISPSEKGDGYAVFDYAACLEQNGQDFTDVEYINVTNTSSAAPVTVTKVEWEGYPVSYGDQGESVGYIKNGATQGIIGYLYTHHVGGEFRAQDMKEDSFFYLEYKGTEANAVDLAFSSVSGAQGGQTTYAVVAPSESGVTGSNYYAKYTIEDLRKQFGDNFARLDQINIATHAVYDNNGNVTSQATAENAALYYFAGTGSDVEANKDDVSWANKPKTGIAFIGDSIVQNPLVTDCALEPEYPAKGDWNALLGRTNVVNYGIGGETSVHISNRFYQLLLDGYEYDKIVMWFGVNDTGLVNSAQEHAERVTGNYKRMLDQVKGKGKKVYVLSILPTGGDFYPTQQDRITATNAALKEMCESGEYRDFVTYVNVHDALLAEDGITANPDLFFDNILHPNGRGYRLVADILNPILGGCYCTAANEADGAVSYKTGYSEDSDYDEYIAAYDKDGVLIGAEKNKASGSFDAEGGIKTLRAFFWEKNEMRPIGDTVLREFN